MTADITLQPPAMSAAGRYLVLAAAFLGWMFAGVQMGIMPLATGPATGEFARQGCFSFASDNPPTLWERLWPARAASGKLLPDHELAQIRKLQTSQWFAWYNAAFLFGAATGGLIFGVVGDRAGRVKALGASILCYSLVSGVSYFARSPEQLLVLRFVAAMGVGGMWPAGVSLASEAWSDVSRPTLAGLIGTAANVGIIAMAVLGLLVSITVDDWRWVLLVGASSTVLGLFVLCCVPESPRWLAERAGGVGRPSPSARNAPVDALGAGLPTPPTSASMWQVFQPPLLKFTLLGICLGAVPLLGGWGTTQWVIPWSDEVMPQDPQAKAFAALMRSTGGAVGSLLGGWIASLMGRRLTYFLISLSSLLMAGYIFRFLTPLDPTFRYWVFSLGFVSTIFFGWLPLYLPELFPTQARATGSGISFNFGRIFTAWGVLGAGFLVGHYQGDYAQVGQITSLVYAVGMVIILFAPDTTRKRLM
jgi:MFS family permease